MPNLESAFIFLQHTVLRQDNDSWRCLISAFLQGKGSTTQAFWAALAHVVPTVRFLVYQS